MMQRRLLATAVFTLACAATPCLASGHPVGTNFLHHAIEGDNSELALGKIAAQRGASPEVRGFGRMLAIDHTKGRAEAAAVARNMHTDVPSSMAAEAIRERGKLLRLSGHNFDREFASYMVEDHEKDIADFEAEAAAADKPQIVVLAKKTLPVLHKHLDTARRLAAAK